MTRVRSRIAITSSSGSFDFSATSSSVGSRFELVAELGGHAVHRALALGDVGGNPDRGGRCCRGRAGSTA